MDKAAAKNGRGAGGTLGLLLLAGVLGLAGCRAPPGPAPEPFGPPEPSAVLPPAAPSASPYPGRAYLAVTAIEAAPSSVRRYQPFVVKLRVVNRGGRAVESFEVQAQANLEAGLKVLSYPVGGREKVGLKPGQSAEITLARPEGLPLAGVYTITADLRLTEREPVEDTDRVDSHLPTAEIIVTK
jgi:hypothetical protein